MNVIRIVSARYREDIDIEMDNDVVLEMLESNSAIEYIAEDWSRLEEKIEGRSFIHYHQWYMSYLLAYPEQALNSWFAVMRREDEIIAIFPLQYARKTLYGVSLSVWRIFWPGDMGINDFIFEKNIHSKEYIKYLIDHLRSRRDTPWHLLLLQNIPENSCVFHGLSEHPLQRQIVLHHHDSKYITCKSNYDESVSELSTKFKRNNRRKLRKLQTYGVISYKMAEKQEELNEAFEHFVEIEASSWKGESRTALKYDICQQVFYRKLLDTFGLVGQCKIFSLWLDEKPIASQFALIINDTYFLLKIGYDSSFQEISPGSLLLNETVRRYSGHKIVKYISFITDATWNDDWAPKKMRVYDYYIYNKNILSVILYVTKLCKCGLQRFKRLISSKGKICKL